MEDNKIDYKYYINVAKIMKVNVPRCRLPRPKMKPTIIVDHDEWLPLITVECEVWKHAAIANMQAYISHIGLIPGVIHTAVKDMGNVKLIRVVMILSWLGG